MMECSAYSFSVPFAASFAGGGITGFLFTLHTQPDASTQHFVRRTASAYLWKEELHGTLIQSHIQIDLLQIAEYQAEPLPGSVIALI